MVARVTAGAVKEIISTNIADDVIDTNHIDTAHTIVEEHLVGLTPLLSDPMLKKIELYLAAHFVALTEEGGALTRSKLGDGDDSFANVYEQGYKSTRYGQTALAIDSSGVLSNISTTSLKADFRVV